MSNLSGQGAEKVKSHNIPLVDLPRRLAGRRPHRHDREIEGAGLTRRAVPTIPVHG